MDQLSTIARRKHRPGDPGQRSPSPLATPCRQSPAPKGCAFFESCICLVVTEPSVKIRISRTGLSRGYDVFMSCEHHIQ